MTRHLPLVVLLICGCTAERGARGGADPAQGGGDGGGGQVVPPADGEGEGEGVADPGPDGGGAGEGEGEGGGGGIPENEDSAPCRVLVECMLPCQDPACETACLLRASDEAKEVWEDMKTCAEEQGCEVTDFECMMNSCSEPAEACMRQGGEAGGPGGGPGGGFGGPGGPGDDGRDPPELGDSACAEVLECAAACPDSDCELDCYSEANDDSRSAVAEVLACQEMVCEGRLPCIQDRCQQHLDACVEEEVRPLSCAGLLTCVVFICAGDNDCIQPCDRQVDDATYNLFDALQQCVFQECGQPDLECAQQQCGEQYAACTGGEVEELPEGLSCGGVVECMQGCVDPNRGRECRRACEDRADDSSYDALDRLLDCMLEADCPDFDFECGGEQCPEELGACNGHVLE